MKKMFKKNQVIITALAIMIAVAGYLNFSSDSQVLNTSVEDMKSEGASGNSDDDLISAAVEDTVEEDVAENDAVKDDMKDNDATKEKSEATGEDVESVDGEAVTGEDVESVDGETATGEDGQEESEDVAASEDDSNEDLAEASVDENGDPIDSESVGEAVLTNASVTLSQAKLNREQTRSKAKEMLLEIINNENLSEDSKKEAVSKMIAMTEQIEKEAAAETQLAAKGFTDAIVSISDDCVDVTLAMESITDTQRTQIEDIIMRKTGCELSEIVITTTQK